MVIDIPYLIKVDDPDSIKLYVLVKFDMLMESVIFL